MTKTFWKIINESKIEIPEIQRDYAQGRDTEKATYIRKKFVKDLIDACFLNNKKLHLDFVFGQTIDKISQSEFERNKESLKQMNAVLSKFSKDHSIQYNYEIKEQQIVDTDNQTLIPIDGQQRLTTLFILHLYIGAQIKSKDINSLCNFSYKTRRSSTDFISQLVKESEILKQDDNYKIIEISNEILDQPWFFYDWIKDPSVSGILRTLNEIHRQCGIYKKEDFEGMWEKLISDKNPTIVFDFFDIQANELDDDIYIKMNARGKSLSDFETFKAWLEKKYKEDSAIDLSNWSKNIDKDWLDIFWDERLEVENIDQSFLSFLKSTTLLNQLAKNENKYFEKEDKLSTQGKNIINRLSSTDFVPTSYYQENELFNSADVNFCFSILEKFSSSSDRKLLNEIVSEIWTDTFKKDKPLITELFKGFNIKPSNDHVYIYAIIIFILIKRKSISRYSEIDILQFKDWLRISRNVVYNTRIDSNVRFAQAIRALNKLEEEKILNIRAYLESFSGDAKDTWIDFFVQRQQLEEIEKIKLDESWTEHIKKAENHFYFYGQISFILELSKIGGTKNLSQFNNYYRKLEYIFSKQNLIDEPDKFRVQRLLLAVNDKNALWMKALTSGRWSFYENSMLNTRDRDENWRTLFTEDKLKYLKTLLQIDNIENLDIDKYLNELKKEIDDWRYFFIDEPKLIGYCSQRLINWSSENHIRLLGSSRLSHYHYELRSLALYLEEFEQDKNITYEKVKRGSYAPFINLKYKGNDYQIIFERNEAVFKYKLSTDEHFRYIYNEIPLISDKILNFKTLIDTSK